MWSDYSSISDETLQASSCCHVYVYSLCLYNTCRSRWAVHLQSPQTGETGRGGAESLQTVCWEQRRQYWWITYHATLRLQVEFYNSLDMLYQREWTRHCIKTYSPPFHSVPGSVHPEVGTRVMIFSSFRESVQEIAAMLNRHSPLIRVMTFMGQASAGKGVKGFTQKEQLEVKTLFLVWSR